MSSMFAKSESDIQGQKYMLYNNSEILNCDPLNYLMNAPEHLKNLSATSSVPNFQ